MVKLGKIYEKIIGYAWNKMDMDNREDMPEHVKDKFKTIFFKILPVIMTIVSIIVTYRILSWVESNYGIERLVIIFMVIFLMKE